MGKLRSLELKDMWIDVSTGTPNVPHLRLRKEHPFVWRVNFSCAVFVCTQGPRKCSTLYVNSLGNRRTLTTTTKRTSSEWTDSDFFRLSMIRNLSITYEWEFEPEQGNFRIFSEEINRNRQWSRASCTGNGFKSSRKAPRVKRVILYTAICLIYTWDAAKLTAIPTLPKCEEWRFHRWSEATLGMSTRLSVNKTLFWSPILSI